MREREVYIKAEASEACLSVAFTVLQSLSYPGTINGDFGGIEEVPDTNFEGLEDQGDW